MFTTGRNIARIAILALACCAAVQKPPSGGSGAGSDSIRIPFENYTLPNGLTVILSPDHTTPTVAVNIWYHVGSKNEVPGRMGFAHLFEHIMFTGSGHVPYGMHDKLTEGVGGSNNGTTSNDRTTYYETVPSNYLESALWLESDRMGYLLDKLDLAKDAAGHTAGKSPAKSAAFAFLNQYHQDEHYRANNKNRRENVHHETCRQYRIQCHNMSPIWLKFL